MSKVKPQIEEPPPPTDLDGYDIKLSPADLAALTKATILDFHVGLIYQTPRQIGMKDLMPGFEPQYELVDHEVMEATVNQDLQDFQQFLKKQNAYLPEPPEIP